PPSTGACAFLFNATAPTQIFTLSLHDALPISRDVVAAERDGLASALVAHSFLVEAVDVHVPGVGSDRGAVTTGVAVVGASELGASRPTAWGRRGATVGGARTLPDDDHEQIAGTDRVGIGRSNAGARCCRVDRRGCGLEPDGRIRRAGRFDGE